MASPKPTINAAAMAAEVDEAGKIDKELESFRPKIARLELLRKSIRSRFDDSPASLPFEASGDKFSAAIGARANERTINPAKLIKAIGLRIYATIAFPTLKALEAKVKADVIAGVVTVGPTGTRPLKFFERITKK